MTVRLISLFSSEKKPTRNDGVVQAGDHRADAINQLEAEPEVDQHSSQ